MSKLVWDVAGERYYETGVKQGVLYTKDATGAYGSGVAWNGLTSVSEKPTGADVEKLYADDTKYLELHALEEFEATIEAYTYPDEFAQFDGSASLADGVMIGQQSRGFFGLSYRTAIGNDVDGDSHGYKLHLIYGCTASPSERSYSTINDSPEAITFSWDITTTPVAVTGYKNTSCLTIDSTKVQAAKLAAFEDILYGVNATEYDSTKTYNVGDYCTKTESSVTTTYKCNTASTTGTWDASKWDVVSNVGPRMPLPDEVATLFAAG